MSTATPPPVTQWTSVTILETVTEVLEDALGLDEDEITLDARIPTDLGAESVDFLDIIYRLEKELHTKLPRGEIFPRDTGESSLNTELTEEIFEEISQATTFTKLQKPEGRSLIIGDLFTVRLLCQAVAHKVGVPWADPVLT